ncbi:hypothetical protein J3T99_05475 [Acetobacteraceae bacterium B3987]|nr:hypothetical protein [Acetobacteraceae bacterium B3987]
MDDNYRKLLDQVAQLSDVVLAMMEADCEFRSLLMSDESFVRHAAQHRDSVKRYDQAFKKVSRKMKEFLTSLEEKESE